MRFYETTCRLCHHDNTPRWLCDLLCAKENNLSCACREGSRRKSRPVRPFTRDPQFTPGVSNPEVTPTNIKETICKSGWAATVRPPASYTNNLKTQGIAKYGYDDPKLSDYEEDHFISLEIGGNPKDPNNLWREPCDTKIKDQRGGDRRTSEGQGRRPSEEAGVRRNAYAEGSPRSNHR